MDTIPSAEQAPASRGARKRGVLHDLHRDWLRWSRAERAAAAVLAAALLLLVASCAANGAGLLP
jgi:hypothetical protein